MEKFLTVQEVAEMLNCHKQSVYRNEELPIITLPGIGKRCRESDLNKYLEQKRSLSPYFIKNQSFSLTKSPDEAIFSLGGFDCGMPKGKTKTRMKLSYGRVYLRKYMSGKGCWAIEYYDSRGKRIRSIV